MPDTMILTALYEDLGLFVTRLGFQAHCDASLCLTVIHEATTGVASHDFDGNGESQLLVVQDNESVVILARFAGSIVASALFQVERHIEDGYVLRPVCLVNAIVDQCETARIEAAMRRAIEAAVCSSPLMADIERVLETVESEALQ
jgi:hypothetical protein